jgi:hypothetical protein
MRYLKTYRVFESSAATEPAAPTLTKDQIGWLNSCTAGSWKLNPTTRLIDVDGDFDCSSKSLTDLKGIKFGKVSGDFNCGNNQLTSLEGAPQSVGWGFYCNNNQLTSLEGAPQSVDGGFSCGNNQLTSLDGAPQSVGWNFNCNNNQLTSLEGAPRIVGSSFSCSNNQLTDLKGAPQTVDGSFYCNGNQLTDLEGAPQSVGSSFNCNGNPVSKETLASIFALMKKGKSYQQALEEHWPKMGNDDRALMYKQMPNLPPEETRKYQALATVSKIKGYL